MANYASHLHMTESEFFDRPIPIFQMEAARKEIVRYLTAVKIAETFHSLLQVGGNMKYRGMVLPLKKDGFVIRLRLRRGCFASISLFPKNPNVEAELAFFTTADGIIPVSGLEGIYEFCQPRYLDHIVYEIDHVRLTQ